MTARVPLTTLYPDYWFRALVNAGTDGPTLRSVAYGLPAAPIPGGWRATLDRAVAHVRSLPLSDTDRERALAPILEARTGVEPPVRLYDPDGRYRCSCCGKVHDGPDHGWRLLSKSVRAGRAADRLADLSRAILRSIARDDRHASRSRSAAAVAVDRVDVTPGGRPGRVLVKVPSIATYCGDCRRDAAADRARRIGGRGAK